jgi:hypothetical protein
MNRKNLIFPSRIAKLPRSAMHPMSTTKALCFRTKLRAATNDDRFVSGLSRRLVVSESEDLRRVAAGYRPIKNVNGFTLGNGGIAH